MWEKLMWLSLRGRGAPLSSRSRSHHKVQRFGRRASSSFSSSLERQIPQKEASKKASAYTAAFTRWWGGGGPLACTRKQQLHTWASRVRLDKPLIHHSSALLEGTTGRSASYALGAKDLCDLLCGLGRRLRLTWYSRGANQPTARVKRSA